MSELLTVSHLTAGYGGRAGIADVSFTLNKGEILCLVGESGCGKTTVLRSLIAAPEVQLMGGELVFDGAAVSTLSDKERRALCCRRMGIVFQTPETSFDPIRSYRRQFIETLKSHGKYDRAAFEAQVAAACAKVELPDDILDMLDHLDDEQTEPKVVSVSGNYNEIHDNTSVTL